MNRRQLLLSTSGVWAARDTFAQTPTQPATGGLLTIEQYQPKSMLHLTSGYGDNLREVFRKLQSAHPGRFVVFTEPA